MKDMDIGAAILTILGAVVGVSIISVIVGSSNTANVLTAGGNAFSSILKAATAPATGGGLGGLTGGGSLSLPSLP